MTDSLLTHLRDSLGSSFSIEQELGGGGMSRVFVATEIALDRRVVIKVLPPELSALVQQGMRAEGILRLKKSLELSQRRAIDVAHLIHIYVTVGQRDSAQKLLAELEERAAREYVAAFAFAVAYTGLGEKDRAFQWLNTGVDNYDPSLSENWFDPAFESLHSDPRWKEFLKRMGVVG